MNEQSERLAALADAQRENTTALRVEIAAALIAGMTWRAIGDALGLVHHETVFRQFKAGSPIVVVNAVQGSSRPCRSGGERHRAAETLTPGPSGHQVAPAPGGNGAAHVTPPSRE